MCGIVAYIGEEHPEKIIIEGLQRLEYRGYDSAGIMLANSDSFDITKVAGKVESLSNALAEKPAAKMHIGMGHTRWATHGKPTQNNAHPHVSQNGDLVLVHNGIIENYSSLKEELTNRGYSFQSDTDSEVLLNLIEDIQNREGLKLGKAVQVALQQVIGAYGLVVYDRKKPNELVVARLGSPLAIGIAEGAYFVGSDATPFLEQIGAYTPYLGLGLEFKIPCPSKIVYLIPESNSSASKPS